jgi:hypothetical protein
MVYGLRGSLRFGVEMPGKGTSPFFGTSGLTSGRSFRVIQSFQPEVKPTISIICRVVGQSAEYSSDG